MLFSSMIFLWIFLPIVFVIYHIAEKKYKNWILLVASLIFYAWGEPKYIILMIISISINYCFGILIDNMDKEERRKILVIACVIVNLSLLAYFKYYDFFVDNINTLLKKEVLEIKNIMLPIGISFYTFQALSYVIDVYRSRKDVNQDSVVQKNILDLMLYITFFPQLIAGPIVKYHDIEKQIKDRTHSLKRTVYGIKRFIYGLSKKVLISNVLALAVDQIFANSPSNIGTVGAWVTIICYAMQIYFDFSGYSDMAIGLGEMFGFSFMENFNYPYIAQSIQEFWRRWHISLSTWFKEYLYVPLGGNRRGEYRTYVNLLIVFFATGLWHGASWNFIFWGLWHGFFLILERRYIGNKLKDNKLKFINHIYVFMVVIIGWVFFRAESFSYALEYLKIMFVPSYANSAYSLQLFMSKETLLVGFISILLCGFLQKRSIFIKNLIQQKETIEPIEIILLTTLFAMCIIILVSENYNPFIYFRF